MTETKKTAPAHEPMSQFPLDPVTGELTVGGTASRCWPRALGRRRFTPMTAAC